MKDTSNPAPDAVCPRRCCSACDGPLPANAGVMRMVCNDCEYVYPDALLKATHDEFHYALQLRTGIIIRFSYASFYGDFVHLTFDELYAEHLPFPFHPDKADKRGVDVRLSDIVWAADGKTVFTGEGEDK